MGGDWPRHSAGIDGADERPGNGGAFSSGQQLGLLYGPEAMARSMQGFLLVGESDLDAYPEPASHYLCAGKSPGI